MSEGRRGIRSPNGLGKSPQVNITLNVKVDTERRALEVARRMASPAGRRKHMFVAILNAIGDLEKQLGQEVSADMVTGMIMALGARSGPDTRVPVRSINDSPDDLKIVTGTVVKATAQEQSNKALKKRGNLLKL